MNNIKTLRMGNKKWVVFLLLISLVMPILTTILSSTAQADCTNPAVCGGPTGGNHAYQFTVKITYDPSKTQPAKDTISLTGQGAGDVKPETVTITNHVASTVFKFNYYDILSAANACSAVIKQEAPKNACASAKVDGGNALLKISYNGSGNINGSGDNSDTNGANTCKIDGVGWLVCPVMNFMGGIVNGTYDVVQKMLTLPAVNINPNDPNNGLYKAWSMMRNFANIAFVIAFLLIIYSQITSVGISNYGIKKMLPRIIVAAILVNISYWICAVAVDISNILGSNIKGMFDSVTSTLGTPSASKTFLSNGGNVAWDTLVLMLLAGGGIFVGLAILPTLAVFLPILITAVVAVFTVVIVLIVRQALVILLMVIAPLAFVAFLLPNTEKWFKRWRETFTTMLIMFPIIAAIFGASKLASVIIMQSANSWYIQLIGAGVSVVPLALSPLVMKFSSGVLGKVGAFVNNPNKGPFDRMRKSANNFAANRATQNKLNAMDPNKRSFPGRGRMLSFQNKRNAVNKGRSEQLEDLQKEHIANLAVSDAGFRKKVTGATGGEKDASIAAKGKVYQARQESYLASVNPDKLLLDADKAMMEAKKSEIILSVKDPANKIAEVKQQLADAAANGDVIAARAAQDILMNSGNKGKNTLRDALMDVDRNSEVGVQMRKDLAASGMKSSAADVYQWAIDSDVKDENGNITRKARKLGDISKDESVWSSLSDAQAMGQVNGAMKAAVDSGGFTPVRANEILSARGAEAIGSAEKNILQTQANKIPSAMQQPATPTQNAAGSSTTLTVDHNTIPNKPTSNTTIPTTNVTNTTINNSETNNITNKPNVNQSLPGVSLPNSSPGSVDESGRFTPGTVSDSDDYHNGMQR